MRSLERVYFNVPSIVEYERLVLTSPLVFRAITVNDVAPENWNKDPSLIGGAALCQTHSGVYAPALWYNSGEITALFTSAIVGQYDERVGPQVPDYFLFTIADTKLANTNKNPGECAISTTVAVFRNLIAQIKSGTYETLEPGICPAYELPMPCMTDAVYEGGSESLGPYY